MNRNKSNELYQKALNYFPGGVNSPVRAFRSVGGTPIFFEKGKGAYLWDVDGNKYIDYCCSWGPLILGHANDNVVNAIATTAANGTSFGAPTKLENDLAELILTFNKYIEKIRFVSSGTEAVMSAIRLARGFTKRNKILKFEGCYHGHSDSLLVKAGSGLVTFGETSSAGVPKSFVDETIVVPLDNEMAVEEAFSKFKNEIACVIIEPIPANNGLLLQRIEFLKFLRKICTENGTLLLFDEVISGFRVSFCGAAGYYSIQPDIITYGKIIGGGMPVGAYGASKEIMSCISPDGNVYQAGTLSGNPVAMAAGIAQLKACLKHGFYDELARKTSLLINTINQKFQPKKIPFKIHRIGSIFWIAFSNQEYIRTAEAIDAESMKYFRMLHAELLNRGIYIGPSGYEVGFVSEAHSDDDILKTADAFVNALQMIDEL
jgi:glutamate-1-semialdehyde 2,1-aminomutase